MNLKETLGSPTIHPVLFYSAKLGLIYFFFLFLTTFFPINGFLGLFLFGFKVILLLLLAFSILSLGSSFRVGLPNPGEEVQLRSYFMFSFSRHPIYTLLFIMILISLKDYYHDLKIILLAIYTISLHHQIVLKEEEYLQKTLGEDYENYKTKVKRYGFF